MKKLNPWIKVGAGLAVGARLGQWLMAAVETAAGRWLTNKSAELKAKLHETEEETEKVDD